VREGWRLKDIWFKYSRPMGGMRMMNYVDFVDALLEWTSSFEMVKKDDATQEPKDESGLD